MKRLLCMILALLLLLMAVGCNEAAKVPPEESDTQERGTEPGETTAEPDNSETKEPMLKLSIPSMDVVDAPVWEWETLQAQLIEADFFDGPLNADRLTLQDGKKHLPMFQIDTIDQLKILKNVVYGGSSAASAFFDKATKNITQKYLNAYTLFVAYAVTESSSHEFRVDVDTINSSMITVNVVRDPSASGNDGAGAWLTLVTIDTTDLPDTVTFDALLKEPDSIAITDPKLFNVQYFERKDYSHPTECAGFYDSALNTETLDIHYSCGSDMPVFRFDTADELNAFYTTYRTVLTYNGNEKLEQEIAAMDQEFFNTHSLLVVYVISTSGSFSYYVKGVERSGDTATAHIKQSPFPEDCMWTCDMDAWMALIPIERSELAGITHFDAFVTYEH